MKFKLTLPFILSCLVAGSAIAQDFFSDAKEPGTPDKQKFSYAIGMRMGQQLKDMGAEVDPDAVAQAIKDVMAGNATQLKESEIRPLLAQAQAAGRARLVERNKARDEAFLARNAKEPGVTALANGVQYRVLQAGSGESPKRTDLVTVNLRGKLPDGSEFRRVDNMQMPFTSCPSGVQSAMELMKVGAKWEIVVPVELAFSHARTRDLAHETTLIYELELVSAEPESAHPGAHQGRGRLGHALDEDFYPSRSMAADQNTRPEMRRNVITNNVPPADTVK